MNIQEKVLNALNSQPRVEGDGHANINAAFAELREAVLVLAGEIDALYERAPGLAEDFYGRH